MIIKTILCYSVVVATLSLPPSQVDLTGIKCVVQGQRPAVQTAVVGYKNGTIYLCCDRSADDFEQDIELFEDAKFTIKANHQLVLTGQYVQKVCPISGEAVDEIFSTSVGAVKIGFACADCRAKVTQLQTIEEKVELLFSNEAFDKAFEPKAVVASLTNVESGAAVRQQVSGIDAQESSKETQRVAERSAEEAPAKK